MSTAHPRLITGQFVLIVASGLAYFLALTMLSPVIPRYVEGTLGGGSARPHAVRYGYGADGGVGDGGGAGGGHDPVRGGDVAPLSGPVAAGAERGERLRARIGGGGTFSSFFDLPQGLGALVCGGVAAVAGYLGAFAAGAVLSRSGLVHLRSAANLRGRGLARASSIGACDVAAGHQ